MYRTFLVSTIIFSLSFSKTSGQSGTKEYITPKVSTVIFDQKVNARDANNDKTIPFYDHVYTSKTSPCSRYIFRPDWTVDFESSCAVCYTTRRKVGNYAYIDKNLIEINSDSIEVYHKFVDFINLESNNENQLKIEVFDPNGLLIGQVISVMYRSKYFLGVRGKKRYASIGDYNELINKNIFVEQLTLEVYFGKERKLFYIPINEEIFVNVGAYKIQLRKVGYRIQKVREKILLLKWNHSKQTFEKNDKLIYGMG